MAFSEKIRLVIDVTTGNASSQLGKLRTDLGNAEGAFGKMRVAGSGAFDLLKQNAAVAVTAIGTALVGFGAKAVDEFQKAALGAGELRDALGISAEEASRFQEVAGDLGIGVGSLQSAIGRMNRSAASTPDAFADIGASIVRSADGAIDVTETFISAAGALDRIPDAARRAEAGQKIFGRGWMEISELIASGADGIREAMASVEDGKIMDDREIAKAREFRDAMDELKGVAEEFAINVGAKLVPALADAADDLGTLFGKVDDFTQSSGWAFLTGDYEFTNDNWGMGRAAIDARLAEDALDGLGERTNFVTAAWDTWQQTLQDYQDDQEAATDAAEEAAKVQQENAAAVAEHRSELERLNEIEREAAEAIMATIEARRAAADAQFAANQAQREFAETLAEAASIEPALTPEYAATMESVALAAADAADAHVRLAEEQAAARGETLLASETGDVWRSSMLNQAAAAQGPLRDAILGYIDTVEGIPPEKLSEIKALIDQGRIAEAERKLNDTSRKREAEIRARATGDADTVINRWARTRDATIRVRAVRQGGGFIAPSGAIFEAEGGYSPGAVNVAGETGQLEFAGRGMVSSPTMVPRGTRVTGVRDTASLVRDMIESNRLLAAAIERRGGTDGAAIAQAVAAGVSSAMRAEQKNLASALRSGSRFG